MTSHSDEQARLSRELHDRADATDAGTPIGLDDVRRTARGIRRRRRIGTGLAVAAVLAVAVPVGLTTVDVRQGNGPVGPATASPRPTPASPQPSPTEQVDRLTAVDAGRGAPPAVDYLDGRTLHLANGSAVELPEAYRTVTAYHGGFLAVADGEQGPEIVQIDAAGEEISRDPGDGQLAISADGTEVAWLTTEASGSRGTLHRAVPSGSTDAVDEQAVPGNAGPPVGFVAPGRLVYQRNGTETQAWLTDFAGDNHRLDGLITVGGVWPADGLVTGMTSVSDTGSCWVVRDVDSGNDRWDTCAFSLGRFSPDGRYVVGYPAYRDGFGDTELAILDARDGRVVAHWRTPASSQGASTQVVWEDSNLLTTFYEDGAWHLLRLGDDGSVSQALTPVRASEGDDPWAFPPQP